ncbi:MAG: hypothetical protein ACRC3Y_08885 [Romboutsia sp.]|uniref:hypothetical protein n=1 Tax=Romboutsia sp. TaxID=1965302 RepID=UPI003F2CD538
MATVWISTTGLAITIFTDSIIDSMVNDITGYLSSQDYNGASYNFLNDVDYYCNEYLTSSDTNSTGNVGTDTNVVPVPTSYFDRVMDRVTSLPTYIGPLVIALIVTFIVNHNSKWKVTINSSTYERNGSFSLTKNQDIFVRENTTRTIIPKQPANTNNSSGSSTHDSSSGSTHGGGGGSF